MPSDDYSEVSLRKLLYPLPPTAQPTFAGQGLEMEQDSRDVTEGHYSRGIDPLELIQTIARKTEECLNDDEHREMNKLQINLDFFKQDITPVAAGKEESGTDMPLRSGSKRSRTGNMKEDSPICSVSKAHDSCKFDTWEIKHQLQFDSSSQSVNKIEFMEKLVKEVETISCRFPECISSYQRLRFGFEHNLSQIKDVARNCGVEHKAADCSSESDVRTLLNELYTNTMHKLSSLLYMVRKEVSTIRIETRSDDSCNNDSIVSVSKKKISKKILAEYMNCWIHKNWTNPYPDDECLNSISKELGTDSTVVNNWLINARTRKWRPAIKKAYELGRPSNHLLEDSKNIYDGKPV